ncbi:hypothetical protein KY347_06780 [Candidatus Woesearchaeota archaeon]|nr:hypothetical protein [Candidatus Woesearchaeota archaeon]
METRIHTIEGMQRERVQQIIDRDPNLGDLTQSLVWRAQDCSTKPQGAWDKFRVEFNTTFGYDTAPKVGSLFSIGYTLEARKKLVELINEASEGIGNEDPRLLPINKAVGIINSTIENVCFTSEEADRNSRSVGATGQIYEFTTFYPYLFTPSEYESVLDFLKTSGVPCTEKFRDLPLKIPEAFKDPTRDDIDEVAITAYLLHHGSNALDDILLRIPHLKYPSNFWGGLSRITEKLDKECLEPALAERNIDFENLKIFIDLINSTDEVDRVKGKFLRHARDFYQQRLDDYNPDIRESAIRGIVGGYDKEDKRYAQSLAFLKKFDLPSIRQALGHPNLDDNTYAEVLLTAREDTTGSPFDLQMFEDNAELIAKCQEKLSIQGYSLDFTNMRPSCFSNGFNLTEELEKILLTDSENLNRNNMIRAKSPEVDVDSNLVDILNNSDRLKVNRAIGNILSDIEGRTKTYSSSTSIGKTLEEINNGYLRDPSLMDMIPELLIRYSLVAGKDVAIQVVSEIFDSGRPNNNGYTYADANELYFEMAHKIKSRDLLVKAAEQVTKARKQEFASLPTFNFEGDFSLYTPFYEAKFDEELRRQGKTTLAEVLEGKGSIEDALSFVSGYKERLSFQIAEQYNNSDLPCVMIVENKEELMEHIMRVYQLSHAHYMIGKTKNFRGTFPEKCCGISTRNVLASLINIGYLNAVSLINHKNGHEYGGLPFVMDGKPGMIIFDPTSEQVWEELSYKPRNHVFIVLGEKFDYITNYNDSANLYPEYVAFLNISKGVAEIYREKGMREFGDNRPPANMHIDTYFKKAFSNPVRLMQS